MATGNASQHDSTSTIELATSTGPGDVCFWFRGGSESSDVLRFEVDGSAALLVSGSSWSTWSEHCSEISEGDHVLTWSYVKDSTVHMDGDRWYLDDVCLP